MEKLPAKVPVKEPKKAPVEKPAEKVPVKEKIPKKAVEPAKAVKPRRVQKPKKVVKPKKVPRKPKIVKKPIKPKKIPKLKFGLRPLKKGESYSYTIRYREKGKIKQVKTNLPKNKAVKKVASIVDRTTVRSMETYISGITKTKDIKPPKQLLKKFTLKKSKTGKVLKLVEKSKHTIDTRGEKRGLKVSKLLKKRKR